MANRSAKLLLRSAVARRVHSSLGPGRRGRGHWGDPLFLSLCERTYIGHIVERAGEATQHQYSRLYGAGDGVAATDVDEALRYVATGGCGVAERSAGGGTGAC